MRTKRKRFADYLTDFRFNFPTNWRFAPVDISPNEKKKKIGKRCESKKTKKKKINKRCKRHLLILMIRRIFVTFAFLKVLIYNKEFQIVLMLSFMPVSRYLCPLNHLIILSWKIFTCALHSVGGKKYLSGVFDLKGKFTLACIYREKIYTDNISRQRILKNFLNCFFPNYWNKNTQI